ncbi:MAG TPA: DUF5996 family protein [Gemmatimonadales bacterium]|nr:DUF5996 family protein [Gemmatimonadales bacterium]
MLRSPSPAETAAWPSLPLDSWRDTLDTLHMWTQIVGKTRLALAPPENHWWHIAFYLTPRGLTTSPMPYGTRTLSADFDFLDHRLHLRTSEGATRSIPLIPRSVADFYADYLEALGWLGIQVRLRPVPVEVQVAVPFAEDRQHASYDAEAVGRWWGLVLGADRVLKRFRGGFLGKASPVHFFWGSFDLAATRFSGRRAPPHPGGAPNCPDYVMTEAYSHECSSCGFWPGGGPVAEPAFYSYAYPAPPGYADRPVRPAGASYNRDLGEFILPLEAVRTAVDAEAAVLDFCQSTYEAAADLGDWDRPALERL